jgi:hypothetical protein
MPRSGVAGLHTPVAQQRACDWWNVRSVIGPYIRPTIGNGTCAVIVQIIMPHLHATLILLMGEFTPGNMGRN